MTKAASEAVLRGGVSSSECMSKKGTALDSSCGTLRDNMGAREKGRAPHCRVCQKLVSSAKGLGLGQKRAMSHARFTLDDDPDDPTEFNLPDTSAVLGDLGDLPPELRAALSGAPPPRAARTPASAATARPQAVPEENKTATARWGLLRNVSASALSLFGAGEDDDDDYTDESESSDEEEEVHRPSPRRTGAAARGGSGWLGGLLSSNTPAVMASAQSDDELEEPALVRPPAEQQSWLSSLSTSLAARAAAASASVDAAAPAAPSEPSPRAAPWTVAQAMQEMARASAEKKLAWQFGHMRPFLFLVSMRPALRAQCAATLGVPILGTSAFGDAHREAWAIIESPGCGLAAHAVVSERKLLVANVRACFFGWTIFFFF